MDRIFFHIDVNSAFLSWSALKHLAAGETLDLREVPAIVGGDIESRHGVVLAKSIPAKKYGIETGEPVVNAFRKCPTLIMEAPDSALYSSKSKALMNFLSDICPEIEQLSIDECFMDYTPIQHLFPSPVAAALQIKDQIRESFGFTVNIGISDKKVLAKMASDFKKPDMAHTLFTSQIQEKMWPLPVSCLYMCGKSSVQVLQKLGIRTIGELAQADRDILTSHLKSHGILLWEYANGIDSGTVTTTRAEVKGVGNSTTLPHDATTQEEAFKYLLALSDSVASRLRRGNQSASMISVEIKYSSFQSVSRQKLLASPTNTSLNIYRAACLLFLDLWNGNPIRLLGIRSTKLFDSSEPVQLNLFDLDCSVKATCSSEEASPSAEKLAALDKSLDSIRQRYGKTAVVRGSLLNPKPPKN